MTNNENEITSIVRVFTSLQSFRWIFFNDRVRVCSWATKCNNARSQNITKRKKRQTIGIYVNVCKALEKKHTRSPNRWHSPK